MILPTPSDPLNVVAATTVVFGIVVLLLALMVEDAPMLEASPAAGHPFAHIPLDLRNPIAEPRAVAPMAAPNFGEVVQYAQEHLARPMVEDPTPQPPFTAQRQTPSLPITVQEEERIERQWIAPESAPKREETQRLTWTNLVDESAEDLDLPTRLKLIEALGCIGGSWSREILARAYEQESDATVRGAIFLAMRDSKSAA